MPSIFQLLYPDRFLPSCCSYLLPLFSQAVIRFRRPVTKRLLLIREPRSILEIFDTWSCFYKRTRARSGMVVLLKKSADAICDISSITWCRILSINDKHAYWGFRPPVKLNSVHQKAFVFRIPNLQPLQPSSLHRITKNLESVFWPCPPPFFWGGRYCLIFWVICQKKTHKFHPKTPPNPGAPR